jgi:hypothetical protein
MNGPGIAGAAHISDIATSASPANIISDIIRRAEDLPILWESDDSGVACGAPAINVLRCVFGGACEGCRTNNQQSGGG